MIKLTYLDVEEVEVEIAGSKDKVWKVKSEKPVYLNPNTVLGVFKFRETDWTHILAAGTGWVVSESIEKVLTLVDKHSHMERVTRIMEDHNHD